MRLTYIANIRLPTEKAHGIQIMKMCEAFANQGMDVELLVPRRRNDLRYDPFEFYKINRIFKLTMIPCLDLVNFNFARIGFAAATFTFLAFARIYLFFRPCDILYSREQLAGLFFGHYVFELHTLPKKMSRFRRYLFNRASRLIVLTGLAKAELIKSGIAAGKISVMPDAVDIEEFDIDIFKNEARKKLGLPLDKKIILYAGSFLFYKWKGGDLLPAAADFLNDEYLFLLVGGHPWEIKNLDKNLKLKNTLLIPYVRHGLIPYYLKSADILVLPNRKGNPASEIYTSPLKLFEYMASKRPIISSDLPSLREVLTNKEALFFEADNPKDLARAVKEIVQNQKLADQLSRDAYLKVKDYTWDKRAEKIINAIK